MSNIVTTAFVDPPATPTTQGAHVVTCRNCGGHEADTDGDCANCHEPNIRPKMDGTLELRQIELIAKAIQKEQQLCLALAGKTLQHAKRIGELLIEAKQMVPRGEWEEWLARCFNGKKSTAASYMRIATRWDELSPKVQCIAHFGVADAVKALAAPRPRPEPSEPPADEDEQDCTTEQDPITGNVFLALSSAVSRWRQSNRTAEEKKNVAEHLRLMMATLLEGDNGETTPAYAELLPQLPMPMEHHAHNVVEFLTHYTAIHLDLTRQEMANILDRQVKLLRSDAQQAEHNARVGRDENNSNSTKGQ